jgi:hypothetical protein
MWLASFFENESVLRTSRLHRWRSVLPYAQYGWFGCCLSQPPDAVWKAGSQRTPPKNRCNRPHIGDRPPQDWPTDGVRSLLSALRLLHRQIRVCRASSPAKSISGGAFCRQTTRVHRIPESSALFCSVMVTERGTEAYLAFTYYWSHRSETPVTRTMPARNTLFQSIPIYLSRFGLRVWES